MEETNQYNMKRLSVSTSREILIKVTDTKNFMKIVYANGRVK